jgi:hypothetical protein
MRKVAVLPRAAGLVGLLLSALACGNPGSGTTLSPAGPSQDLRLALVDQARWAMSAHNMQPWEIELDRCS